MSTEPMAPVARKRGRPKLPPGESYTDRLRALRDAEKRRKQQALTAEGEDLTRCWGLDRRRHGERCALDKGHYRGRDESNPSPHIGEDGEEWF